MNHDNRIVSAPNVPGDRCFFHNFLAKINKKPKKKQRIKNNQWKTTMIPYPIRLYCTALTWWPIEIVYVHWDDHHVRPIMKWHWLLIQKNKKSINRKFVVFFFISLRASMMIFSFDFTIDFGTPWWLLSNNTNSGCKKKNNVYLIKKCLLS